MNRKKLTLAETPIGYVHTNESIAEEHIFGSLHLYTYYFSNDDTTLICSDVGNGNYKVIAKFGIDTSGSDIVPLNDK